MIKEKLKSAWNFIKAKIEWFLIATGIIIVASAVTLLPNGESIVPEVRLNVAELRTWNSNSNVNPDNSITREIHGKWVNYLSEDGWEQIDTSFTETPEGFVSEKNIFKLIAPLYSDGEGKFINNNRYYNVTCSLINEPILETSLKAMGVEKVKGIVESGDLGWGTTTYVIYKGAYPQYDADLIYFNYQGEVPQLKRLIRFNSLAKAPIQDTVFQFEVGFDKDVYISRMVSNNMTGWTRKSDITNYEGKISIKLTGSKTMNDLTKIRGNTFKPFMIWDSGIRSDRKEELIKVALEQIETSTEKFLLTKTIPFKFFADAKFPVYTDDTLIVFPDPSSGATTVDGHMTKSGLNTSWATVIASATGTAVSNTAADPDNFFQSTATTNQWAALTRIIFTFDTSSIGASMAISAVTLSVWGPHRGDGLGVTPDMDIYTSTPASNNVLVANDFAQIGTTSQTGSPISWANWNLNTAYNVFTFNATGIGNINKTGISRFGARNANYDVSGNAPAWLASKYSYLAIYSADQTGTSTDPKLTITYSAAAAAAEEMEVDVTFTD